MQQYDTFFPGLIINADYEQKRGVAEDVATRVGDWAA